MQKDEFLKIQFESLREEVKETKARIFKTLGFGVTVVPAAHFLAGSYNIDVIVLALPILVLLVGLLYLSENHALMRCGSYIRDHIEPNVEGIVGWEQWLSVPDAYRKRTVDIYLFYTFYILFLVYFTASVFLTARFVFREYGVLPATLVMLSYCVIGVWGAVFFLRNRQVSTTTSREAGSISTG